MAATIGRRAFVKTSLAAGISIVVRPLTAIAQVPGPEPAPGYAWQRTATTAARRIDGWQKVTGAKIYAADFRAVDMPGWPRQTAHAMLIKTPDATHVFEGIELAVLDKELAPDRVVLAADLAAASITVPPFAGGHCHVAPPAGHRDLPRHPARPDRPRQGRRHSRSPVQRAVHLGVGAGWNAEEIEHRGLRRASVSWRRVRAIRRARPRKRPSTTASSCASTASGPIRSRSSVPTPRPSRR